MSTYVSDVEFVGLNTLVFGILHTGNDQPLRPTRLGSIIDIGRARDVDYAGRGGYGEAHGTEVVIQEEIAFIPTIDVAFRVGS